MKEPDTRVSKDDLRINKKFWSPEARAKWKLTQAEERVDRELAAIDEALLERTAGKTVFEQWKDPVLRDLKQARAELLKARADIQAARKALEGGRLPMWKLALNYMGPLPPAPGPDLATAEARLNSALGRLEKAEYLLQDACDKLPPEPLHIKESRKDDPKHIRPIWRPDSLRSRIGGILRDVRASRFEVEGARHDIWEAQSDRPIKPWPPIWRELPPKPDPAPDWKLIEAGN